jgi:sec-independent protein translocase protein TatA
MPNVGPLEIIIVFLIVILLFGVGRISKVSKELGSGIRAFKEGLQGDEDEEKEELKSKDPVEKDE